MQFNEIETKLINLALNGAAHEGEIANSATMLFRQLRKRGVTPAQFTTTSNGSNGMSFFEAQTDYWRKAYAEAKLTVERQTIRMRELTLARERLESEVFDLRVKNDKARADVEAAQKYGSFRPSRPTAPAAKPKGRYYGGILLTDKERALFVRIATSFGAEGSTVTVRRICRDNSEQGSVQGLIKKGLVEKRYNKGLGLTEAGLAHFSQYHRS